MNLESSIKQNAIFLKQTRREIEIAPDISATSLAHWHQKYHKNFSDDIRDFILVLSDTKTGSFALTGDALYYDNYLQGGVFKIAYTDMQSVHYDTDKVFAPDRVRIELCNGSSVDLDACIDGINLSVFTELLTSALSQARLTPPTCSSQKDTLCDIPDTAKLLYLKILCNKAYLDKHAIDVASYNSIAKFAIRMEATPLVRRSLCRYVNEIYHHTKTGNLIAEAFHLLENASGQWDAFRYSLVQDILYLALDSHEDFSWRQDGFVGSLMQTCSLRPEQLDTMVAAIHLNRAMQEKNADLKDLLDQWETLLKKVRYTSGYVPAPYLFCSGSIYGLKEYTGFLRSDDISQKALNKQRELILQKIIENTQQTINLLIEDVNFVAERLEKAIQNSDELHQNYLYILDRFRQGITRLHQTEQATQEELDQSRAARADQEEKHEQEE